MEQVAVHAVGFLRGNIDRNIVFLSVFDHILTSGEVPVGISPGGDDLDRGIDRVGVQLKTDLIVAFAGCSVADGISTLGFCDLDQTLGDEGACNGGSEQIVVLIDRLSLKHREDEITGKLFVEVVDDAFACTGCDGFCLKTVEFLLLTYIGAVTDHLCVISLFDPLDDHGGIQTARISYDYFHFSLLLQVVRKIFRSLIASAAKRVYIRI